ncbi:hypothetical protein EK21DRAFT_106550 [Setomelanomma holmii]|uniref:Uncharacterized protein n=1 Tax=Setomelanomma holmii TaxID=210430 RepID=A0A9P4HJU4_9PLEO|nr:hypothetical protein EK21DRAFT_106550 [Setomelanomma holmii]
MSEAGAGFELHHSPSTFVASILATPIFMTDTSPYPLSSASDDFGWTYTMLNETFCFACQRLFRGEGETHTGTGELGFIHHSDATSFEQALYSACPLCVRLYVTLKKPADLRETICTISESQSLRFWWISPGPVFANPVLLITDEGETSLS